MGKKEDMEETLNVRRLILVLGRRLWFVILGALLGCFSGGLIYLGVTQLIDGEPAFRASSDYYISFNFGEFAHGDDYYNAYTWDGILRDDPIVDYVLTLLPKEITREQIESAVQGEMLGDYRILTVHVTTDKAEMTQQIAQAYHAAMVHFGEIIDMLDHIEVWDRGQVKEVDKHTKAPNAAFLGGLLGTLLSLFGLLFFLLMEDGIYLEEEANNCLHLPVYGLLTKKQDEKQKQLYEQNLAFTFGTKEITLWKAENLPGKVDLERLREAEVLLLQILWQKTTKESCKQLIQYLKIQGCRIDGLVLIEADDRFVNGYYGRKR